MAYKQISPQSVAEGGTGASTLTGVLTGNGTSAVTANAVTQYGVLVGGASNAVASTAVGTATQVLTSNGAGVAPTFQDAGGTGSWIHLSTKTASSSSEIEFTSLISATYTTYLLVCSNVTPSADEDFTMLVSEDNGSSYIVTNYQSQTHINVYDVNTFGIGTRTTSILLSGTTESTSSFGSVGTFYLYNVGNGQQFMLYGDGLYHAGATTKLTKQFLQAKNTSTSVNAFKVLYEASKNIATGTFSLYGVAQ